MKSKTTLLQLLSLMLIGCVIFIGCKGKNVSGGSSVSATAPAINSPRRSGPVSSTGADQLISDYQTSVHVIKTDDGTGRLVALPGFQYEFGQINEIINNNASGTAADKVEQVAFYIAFEPGKKRWHLIAYGMTPPYNVAVTGGTLLDASNTTGRLASIFDDKMSAPFPKDKAEKARSFYTDHLNNIPLNTYDNKDVFRELDGFAFTASQLNQILKKNPDHIALAIGLEYRDVAKTKIRWHIIAYGIKNGNPVGATATGDALLPAGGLYFDKADPCPPCQ